MGHQAAALNPGCRIRAAALDISRIATSAAAPSIARPPVLSTRGTDGGRTGLATNFVAQPLADSDVPVRDSPRQAAVLTFGGGRLALRRPRRRYRCGDVVWATPGGAPGPAALADYAVGHAETVAAKSGGAARSAVLYPGW